ncbi:CABIN-like protein [Mya arenaria]|uniref:CABIN-like protein n=1 Tax=Mya arenaria TaxID=6604 RepID=A0ABY7E399_MYAAR|nr:CABIN-like protein [Mya arenaria]
MLRIAALNVSSSDGSHSQPHGRESTKEAKEAEAFSLYNQALDLLRHGDTQQAEETFRDLIDHDFLVEAWECLEDRGQEAIHPGLQLLYSIQKNLAALATTRKDYKAALDAYLEAVKIDNTEVTVWYKVGQTALAVEDFRLAMLALEQGLDCNPRHWPCLDTLIPILYALNNYVECLYYIGKALEMEVHYMKGYAFMEKIFSVETTLRAETQEFFENCDPEMHDVEIDPVEAEEYVEEALEMRRRNQIVWKHVGKVLCDLYDKAMNSEKFISISLKMNVPAYSQQAPSEQPMETDVLEDRLADQAQAISPDTGLQSGTDQVESAQAGEPLDVHEEKSGSQVTPHRPGELEAGQQDGTPDGQEDFAEQLSTGTSGHVDLDSSGGSEKAHIDSEGLVTSNYHEKKDVTPDSVCDIKANIQEANKEENMVVDTEVERMEVNSTEKVEEYDMDVKSSEDPLRDSICKEAEEIADNAVEIKPEISEEGEACLEVKMLTDEMVDKIVSETCVKRSTSPGNSTEVSKIETDENNLLKVSERDENIKVEMETVESQDGDNSILEALRNTHSLLDSLSPVKTPLSQSYSAHSPYTGREMSPIVIDSTSSSLSLLATDNPNPGTVSTSPPKIGSGADSLSFVVDSSQTAGSISELISAEVAASTPADSGGVKNKENNSQPVLPSAPNVNLFFDSGTSPIPVIPSAKDTPTSDTNGAARNVGEHAQCNGTQNMALTDEVSSNKTAVPLPVAIVSESISASSSSTSISAQSPTVPSSSPSSLVPSAVVSSPGVYTQSSPRSMSRSDHGYSRLYSDMPRSPRSPRGVLLAAGSGGGAYIEVPIDIDEGKKGQKRKRMSLATEEIMMYGKRRSARVRNTGRRKEEGTANFFDLLQAFLPASIKPGSDEEGNTMDTDQANSSTEENKHTGTWDEEALVREYLEKAITNQGLIHLMTLYLASLAQYHSVKWPAELGAIYVGVFTRVRKHMYMPRMFDNTDTPEIFKQTSLMLMMWLELELDRWLAERSPGMVVTSPRSPSHEVLLEDDLPRFYDEDFWFVLTMCDRDEDLGDVWAAHCVRAYWAHARFCILRGKMEEAIYNFEKAQEYLTGSEAEPGPGRLYLPNCALDQCVNAESVGWQLEQLQKSQSVEETQRLYQAGEYDSVVDILLQTFNTDKHKIMQVDAEERQSQLQLLQESLFHAGDWQRCIVWGEESLHECYLKYQQSSRSDQRAGWTNTIISIFNYLLKSVQKGGVISTALSEQKLVRFSQTLIKLIDLNMSMPESAVEMTFDTVLPWILLYHIIKEDEDQRGETLGGKDGISSEEDESLASSHMLNIAHDYLGSRSWCTKSNGALLLFYMSVLKPRLEAEGGVVEGDASRFNEDYQQAFEQCVYCLYGHPNKKGKARHLQDHNAANISLEWSGAVDIFNYFKPRSLPEFDGYRSETISAELEFLLKRIIPLVPEECKHMGVRPEEIQSYIEGSVNTPPTLPDNRTVTVSAVDEVYYLLADYYLKNKESMKAIRFYTHDLSYTPNRLDSWAGMALARMSQLEAKLSSAELKMDTPIYKKSVAALRCFKRATEIDSTNSKLWIEYGTLAYQLHSHASRQIRWKKWFAMDDEFVSIATESKREMLVTATECFRAAGESVAGEREGGEDEWLHNYMQGKCGEKARRHLREYIHLYFKAMQCLHEENAKYPRKIMFSYTTPHLAVEALEIYYRIHVAILKLLLKHLAEDSFHDYKLYAHCLLEAAALPFVGRVEKGQKVRTDRESASSADESSCSELITPTEPEKESSDHTYFRQKSGSNETSGLPASEATKTAIQGQVVENPPVKSVTTYELYSEEQSSKSQPDLTVISTSEKSVSQLDNSLSTTANVCVEKPDINKSLPFSLPVGGKPVPESSPAKQPFSISSILGEDLDKKGTSTSEDMTHSYNASDKSATVTTNGTEKKVEDNTEKAETELMETNEKFEQESKNIGIDGTVKGDGDGKEAAVGGKNKTEASNRIESNDKGAMGDKAEKEDEPEKEVRNVLLHIEDLIESELNRGDSSGKSTPLRAATPMDIDKAAGEKKTTVTPGEVLAMESESRLDDQINNLLKMPVQVVHQALIEKCKRALELCLQRFPTHYKSNYRLAYLYLHSPYHKDLGKAHDILLGAPKWQDLPHMPAQGLFGERKLTKFFQGIWKIPIDEIDRSGSFPAHLNRSIELVMDVLRQEHDAANLHAVHLQLNRQPEPGKKYLRDAEKRYYALTSHRYTLDAVELQITDMKTETDSDKRLAFLQTVYKVWEHGVHKLNKYPDRANRLLAEAYRVVLRKLETLPPKMLLDQAVRFCKQLVMKPKQDKSQDSRSQSQMSSSQFVAVTKTTERPVFPGEKTSPRVSLMNLMKSQAPTGSLLKGAQSPVSMGAQGTLVKPAVVGNTLDVDVTDGKEEISDDVIILSDSSVDSPVKAKPDRSLFEKFLDKPLVSTATEGVNAATTAESSIQGGSAAHSCSPTLGRQCSATGMTISPGSGITICRLFVSLDPIVGSDRSSSIYL